MNPIQLIQSKFFSFVSERFAITFDTISPENFSINDDENKQQFGDISSNIALVLAKQLKQSPHDIAHIVKDSFEHDLIEKIEIAGPGFINIFLTDGCWQELTKTLYVQQHSFFAAQPSTKDTISLEFVSANPTGPLHFGHGRGGIIGDVLARVLRFLHHNVTTEYYINDAGQQIKKLGMSFQIRCAQQLGQSVELPEDAYHGHYLVELADECVEKHGKEVLEKEDSFFEEYAQRHLLNEIKRTLEAYNITFDEWFSEKTLHSSGKVAQVIAILQKNEFIYEKDGALWFKSTEFGDDKDRVVKKATGELTYVAADIAYLQDKVDRGFNKLVMILGHDHHGYTRRLQAALKALNLTNNTTLHIILYQLVSIKESGKYVKLSKRAGKIVSLQDIIQTVGVDVARFFYLHRKADAQLEFDIDLALQKTDDNPVYYVQYAYVRTKSILTKAEEQGISTKLSSEDIREIGRDEALLLKKIIALRKLLTQIEHNHQTHSLTYYAIELATLFHKYYNKHRVIDTANVDTSKSRLVLITIIKQTFELLFDLLGISAPEKM